MPLDIPEHDFIEICEVARIPQENWESFRDRLEGVVEYCFILPPAESANQRKAAARQVVPAGIAASQLLEALGNEVVRQEVSWYLVYQEFERRRRKSGLDVTDDDMRLLESTQDQARLLTVLEEGLRAVQWAARSAQHTLSRRRPAELPVVVQGVPVWDCGTAKLHDHFIIEVIQVVVECGGRATVQKNLNSGSLPAILDKLRPHLPAELLPNVIPPNRLQQFSRYAKYWMDN